jgi:hypothetical protein
MRGVLNNGRAHRCENESLILLTVFRHIKRIPTRPEKWNLKTPAI